MKKKLLVPVTLAILAIAMFGGVASAAQPAIKGCFGETVSALAGPFWGPNIVIFAQEGQYPGDPIGLGDEVQFLQSGGDALIPSACFVP